MKISRQFFVLPAKLTSKFNYLKALFILIFYWRGRFNWNCKEAFFEFQDQCTCSVCLFSIYF